MAKDKQKKTAAKSSSRLSPPPKRQTRLQAANNPAPDQTTFTNRQNATSAPQTTKTTAKAAEKKTEATKPKTRIGSKPKQDEKPVSSDEPQPAKNRKRKAELKENDEDPKVSKKQKLIKNKDQNDQHRKTGSDGDARNGDRSKKAASNPLLSILNAAKAQGENDLKATKRSYIRGTEEDSSAAPLHDGRFTPFPSGPPRSDQNDSGNERQACRDELQKLELETRRRDSQANKSQQQERRDPSSDDGQTGPADTTTKSPQNPSSTPENEMIHDERGPQNPPPTAHTEDRDSAELNDTTNEQQIQVSQPEQTPGSPYPAILDMNPQNALIHLDTLIETLVTKVFASQTPTSSSLVCIKPSRELEKLYQLVFGQDWKSTARHLHEQASLPYAPLLRSLIWSCLIKNILNSHLDIPWPSPHRTASLLGNYFPSQDEQITSLQRTLREGSLRLMKTEKFLHSDLSLHTHSLVHTLYFFLIEHVHKSGAIWKGKELWAICEAALLFKGICMAGEERVEVLWSGSGEGFDGERMEGDGGPGAEVAFTLRPGLAVRDRENVAKVCLVPARVFVMRQDGEWKRDGMA